MLATKIDLQMLEQRLENKIDKLETKFDTKIDNKVDGLRAEMKEMEYRLVIKLGTIFIVGVSALGVLVKF